jgi:Flp pilus assembly protein TadG
MPDSRPTPQRSPTKPSWPRTDERGTALVLAPALVIVLIVLGGLAVDLSLLRSARRALDDAVAAAADDAAGMLDERRLLTDGTVTIDPAAARRIAEARLTAGRVPGRLRGLRVDARGPEVRVDVDVAVPPVFLKALRIGDHRVRATAIARATT